jgi:hypothetical protein
VQVSIRKILARVVLRASVSLAAPAMAQTKIGVVE